MTTPEGARADVTFKIVEGPADHRRAHLHHRQPAHQAVASSSASCRSRQGQPLGLAALTESRRRLSALGLFRRIQISAISHGDPALRDVVIAVEEAPQTTIGVRRRSARSIGGAA